MPPYCSGTFMPSAPSSLSPSTTASGSFASRSISSGSTSLTRNSRSRARNASPFSTAAGSFLGCGWMRSSRRLPRKSSLPKLGFSQPCSRALSATCRASFSLTLLATDDSLGSGEYLSGAGVSLNNPPPGDFHCSPLTSTSSVSPPKRTPRRSAIWPPSTPPGRSPAGSLIGEIDGKPAAALSLKTGVAVADPFQATENLRVHMRMRASAVEAIDREPSLRERMLDAVRQPAAVRSTA